MLAETLSGTSPLTRAAPPIKHSREEGLAGALIMKEEPLILTVKQREALGRRQILPLLGVLLHISTTQHGENFYVV